MIARIFPPPTPAEAAELTIVAIHIRHHHDERLGELLLAIARGEDADLAAMHERLLACGRPDLADRLAAMVQRRQKRGAP